MLHVDGWLCEIKDAQIRDGLHVLGAGARPARRGSTWCWPCCGPARCGAAQVTRCPGLREALGLAEDAPTADRVDAVEERAARRWSHGDGGRAGWDPTPRRPPWRAG